MQTVKLRKFEQTHLRGRVYDWSPVNDIIDGKTSEVKIDCNSSDEARNAYISLRNQINNRNDCSLNISLNGNSLVVRS